MRADLAHDVEMKRVNTVLPGYIAERLLEEIQRTQLTEGDIVRRALEQYLAIDIKPRPLKSIKENQPHASR